MGVVARHSCKFVKNVDTSIKNYKNGRFGCCYDLLQLENVNKNGDQDVK